MNNIICVAGPTASGKTALAVELAKEYGIAVEVLSAFTGTPGTLLSDSESL